MRLGARKMFPVSHGNILENLASPNSHLEETLPLNPGFKELNHTLGNHVEVIAQFAAF